MGSDSQWARLIQIKNSNSIDPFFISSFSVLGAIQSFAGFTDYFTAMAQEGWFPLLCVGLRSQWEDVHLQDLQDSYGQEWVSTSLRSHPWGLQTMKTHLILTSYWPREDLWGWKPNNFSLVPSPLLTDFQSEVVPGVHVLHCVFCQYRNLSDCRCADQENSTSLCVSARLLQVSKDPSLIWFTLQCIIIARDLRFSIKVCVLIMLTLIPPRLNLCSQMKNEYNRKTSWSNLSLPRWLPHVASLVVI